MRPPARTTSHPPDKKWGLKLPDYAVYYLTLLITMDRSDTMKTADQFVNSSTALTTVRGTIATYTAPTLGVRAPQIRL
jgi:hypothetical protein